MVCTLSHIRPVPIRSVPLTPPIVTHCCSVPARSDPTRSVLLCTMPRFLNVTHPIRSVPFCSHLSRTLTKLQSNSVIFRSGANKVPLLIRCSLTSTPSISWHPTCASTQSPQMQLVMTVLTLCHPNLGSKLSVAGRTLNDSVTYSRNPTSSPA